MTQAFSERFAQAWRKPTIEGLLALLAEDVVLFQPHLPPIRGKQAAAAEFWRLFRWIPGTHSTVSCWREDEHVAFIEHELCFPVGNGEIRLPAVDRFLLEDGLGKERRVYFDQALLVRGVLRRPTLWPGYLRYRFDR